MQITAPQPSTGTDNGTIHYKIASSQAEREAAFRLIYQSYLRSGLMNENEQKIRITPYQLQPTTTIFVAFLRGEAISTVTLVLDSLGRLPLDDVYPELVAQRRLAGLKIGEVTCLADRRKHVARRYPVIIELFRRMIQYAKQRDLDQVLLAVHPKHVKFYERQLACQVIGEQRLMPSVQNNPGVGLCLDFDRIDRERPRNYDKFFGTAVPPEELASVPITPSEQAYFRSLIGLASPGLEPADGSFQSSDRPC